jgi:hypothetical protein
MQEIFNVNVTVRRIFSVAIGLVHPTNRPKLRRVTLLKAWSGTILCDLPPLSPDQTFFSLARGIPPDVSLTCLSLQAANLALRWLVTARSEEFLMNVEIAEERLFLIRQFINRLNNYTLGQ